MDDLTTAVMLVHHESQDRAEAWFEAICELHGEVADTDRVWDEFRERWPEAAATRGFTPDTAEEWIRQVEDTTHDPASVLRELSDRRSELGYLYASESAAATAAERSAAADAPQGSRFGWLREDATLPGRVEMVFQYQPEHYDEYLGPYLDQYWGAGWDQNPDDHKRAWLGDMLTGLEALAATPADTSADQAAAEHEAADQVSAASAASAATPETADVAAAEEVGQALADVLAQAMAETPGAADLPPDVVEKVLADALAAAQPAPQ